MRTLKFALLLCLLTQRETVIGDDDFPEPYNSPSEADQSPMQAAQAAQAFIVPEGFKATVFAAEPDVQNPIDMSWDAAGRLWIAENYTYAERSQRFDLGLRDRVVVLSDTNGDGKADDRKVFTDTVQMLTSVEVGNGGVWLMCPPQLLFIPDRDHDAVPDGPVEVIADGFDVAQDNYHNFANGLRFGPDGWLYGRCGGSCPGNIGLPGTPIENRVALEGGIWRYHPSTKAIEVLTHGTTNPWGHDWNELGEGFFINTVNGHLWHMIPGAHFVRPFTLDPNPYTYEMIDMHADHWHFDTNGKWQESRDGVANEFGGGHAHSGMMIYLGGNWPKQYHNELFTLNFHGQRANHESLVRDGSGFVGEHNPDMLISQDPFFRGMELSYGPAGSVFVIDWSDTGECHEHTGVHRTSGRVYEIAYHNKGQSPTREPINLYDADLATLLDYQNSDNEWYVRQARLVLAERSSGTLEGLDSLVEDRSLPVDARSAFRKLMVLNSVGLADRSLLIENLDHPDEAIRSWCIRLLTDRWPIDDCYGPITIATDVSAEVVGQSAELQGLLIEIATSDPSAMVRLTLASTLQRLPVGDRLPLASALLTHGEDASDHNLPLMIWYGMMAVGDVDPVGLARAAVKAEIPLTARSIARRVSEEANRSPAAIDVLVAGMLQMSAPGKIGNLAEGIRTGLRGFSKVNMPTQWTQFVTHCESLKSTELSSKIRDLSIVFGDGRAMADVRSIVLDESIEANVRRSALKTLVENRLDGMRDVCLKLLTDPRFNSVAAEGLSTFDDEQIGAQMVKAYRNFRSPERSKVISILVSRPKFAQQLLAAIANGKMDPSVLTAFDVRQIRSLGSPELDAQVSEVWGDVRDSSVEKVARIEELKKQLTTEFLAESNKPRGRTLFNKNCSQCHRMYGEGEMVGPELTGSNRNNIDYLLENMIDPSAVVGKDFRMTIILLDDGRVINGLVMTANERTVTIQTQTDRMTINRAEIEELKVTDLSPMPEGILDNLTEEQIRDLIGYLMHPTQVPAESLD